MKCVICNVSLFEKTLHRTKPMGQPDGGWTCEECLKKTEPELHDELKKEGDFKITNEIFKAINSSKK